MASAPPFTVAVDASATSVPRKHLTLATVWAQAPHLVHAGNGDIEIVAVQVHSPGTQHADFAARGRFRRQRVCPVHHAPQALLPGRSIARFGGRNGCPVSATIRRPR